MSNLSDKADFFLFAGPLQTAQKFYPFNFLTSAEHTLYEHTWAAAAEFLDKCMSQLVC